MKTMKVLSTITGLALALNLTACAKSEDKKKKSDAEIIASLDECSDSVKTEFSEMVQLAMEYQQADKYGNTAQKLQVAKPLAEACTKFLAEHGESSCKITSEEGTYGIDGHVLRRDCDSVKATLKNGG